MNDANEGSLSSIQNCRQKRPLQRSRVAYLLLAFILGTLTSWQWSARPANAEDELTTANFAKDNVEVELLSGYWKENISQWSEDISFVSEKYGINADLVAAVVQAESHGDHLAESYVGAVGLMGVMPAGPGFEWRPSPEELRDPAINLEWGTAIFVDILGQSGGDVAAALAAYNGGWRQAHLTVPRNYAAEVLDHYARAVVIRSGVSPEFASKWSVAIEQDWGHISAEPMIIDQQPVSGWRQFGEHVLYAGIAPNGRALHLKAYAVPLVVVQSLPNNDQANDSDSLPLALLAQLGEADKAKLVDRNTQAILTCLPSLNRLRGRISTRWFAPASCPAGHR